MRRIRRRFASSPKLVISTICVAASITYIGYRFLYTLPLGLGLVNIVFGLLVFAIELIELFELIVCYWNNLRFRKKSPKTPEVKESKLEDVDVFVATLNEDTKTVGRTLCACKKMKYPKNVTIYLCDDGDREEMAALAEKLGVNYLARKKHDYAKAGNYNYAMKHSESPYIAMFDADMCPNEDFLMKTMPFFAKKEMLGFVQAPQCFKNPDMFQSRFSSKMPCEQDYFYRYIQLARNRADSTILCGTNCVISREALKSVGGFACVTIAEDIATGMLMQAKGYHGIAIAETLVYGEAIDDYRAFLRQRSRWARGCIQTAKSYGIFSVKGLKKSQKMDYFVAINYWCFGLKRMLFMLLPLFFVFFHIIAIEGDLKVFIPLFLVQYVLKRFVVDWTEKSGRSGTWTKIFEFIQAPYLAWVVLKELIGFSSKKFVVTPKDVETTKKSATDWVMALIHSVLLAADGFGIALAAMRLNAGEIVYLIPLVWMAVNTLYLLIAVRFDLRKSRRVKNFNPDERKKFGLWAYLSLVWRVK